MKTKFFKALLGIAAVAICVIILYACNNDEEYFEPVNDMELEGFFKSVAYTQFSNSYNLSRGNLKIEQIVTEKFERLGMTIYYIPVTQKEKIIGRLLVASKANGKIYKTLYENLKGFDINGGEIKHEINGRFVSRYKCTPSTKSGEFYVQLIEVASPASTSLIKTKSEYPYGDGGYWDCIVECERSEYERCMDDPICWALCVALELGQTYACNLSLGAACILKCL